MEVRNKQYGALEEVNLQSNQQEKKRSMRTLIVAVLIFMVFIVTGAIVKNNYSQQSVQKEVKKFQQKPISVKVTTEVVQAPPQGIVNRQTPWLEIASKEQGAITVGANAVFLVSGFSGGKDVTGYDTLIEYDHSIFELVSVQSLLPQYDIFKTDRDGHVSITGIKNLEHNEASIFESTPFVAVELKAKAKGTSELRILNEYGKERTQLVDPEVHAIKPQTNSITVQVQ